MIREIFLCVFFALIFTGCKQQGEVKADKGILEHPFSSASVDDVRSLNGEWAFYWGKFYTPSDFSNGNADETPLYVEVPNTWTLYEQGSEGTFPKYGVATYRLEVKLKQPMDDMGLFIPKIWSASKVWVNGKLYSEKGKLIKKEDDNLILEQLVDIGSVETVDIVAQVSNYGMFVGGLLEPFRLGKYHILKEADELDNIFALIWVGCVLIMGVYHFTLYFFRKNDYPQLYIGLVCLLIVIKMMVYGTHDIYEYLKVHDGGLLGFKWQGTLYYGSTYLLPCIGLLYVRSLYPEESSRQIVKIVTVVILTYCAFLIVAPMHILLPTVLPFQALIIPVGIYIVYVIVRATIKSRKYASVLSLGIVIMLLAGANDALYTFGIALTPNPELVPLSFGVFLLLQFFILADRYADAFMSLKQLSASLEEKVVQRTAEVTRQKEEIEKQNESIRSSIQYAKRIQDSLLPSDTHVKEIFPTSFVFFRPRDVVSGDFYFVEEIDWGEGQYYKVIAAIDCTGHGVPGAFMSMIGDTLLRKIIHDMHMISPDNILEALNEGVVAALKQNITENKDGMDMALCVVDYNKKELLYAGASNPLVYVKGGEKVHIKADKLHIGGAQRGKSSQFTKHVIKLDDDIVFYLYSDGFQDQIGGTQKRKFMTKKLREMLFDISESETSEQYQKVKTTFEEWTGDNKQVDDVLLIGVKLEKMI